jgi:hypothetical protein
MRMTEEEVKEAIADLRMLWGDVEWWEEQGLSRVRPTLKAALDAVEQLKKEAHYWAMVAKQP